MAAGNWIVYNAFKKYMSDSTFNLTSTTVNVALHTNTYAPALTDTNFAAATNELSTANGYTAGGAALTSVSFTQTGQTATYTSANPSWTASGGSIGPFRIATLHGVGTLNGTTNPLMAYCILDSADITVTTGNTFTIQINASGIFTISGATS
jgi:hypothetical protein